MNEGKISKVLIALDYNPTAQKVAEVGFSLSKSIGAETILLHVITDPVYYSSREFSPIVGYGGYTDMSPTQLDNIETLKKASQHFLDNFKKHLGEESIQTLIKEGEYAECILKAAKEMKADMIVIGSHSRRWLENIVMGSVTEKVLHETTLPLFIIPTKKSK